MTFTNIDLPLCKEILTSFNTALDCRIMPDDAIYLANSAKKEILDRLSKLDLKEKKPRCLWIIFGELDANE